MIFSRKCKPSRSTSTDKTLPQLTSAWVRPAGKTGEADELIATDSIQLARVPLVEGHGLKPGPVAPAALALLERGREHFVDEHGGVVVFDGDTRVTYAQPAHDTRDHRGRRIAVPPFVATVDNLIPEARDDDRIVEVGLNARALHQLADSIGAHHGTVRLRLLVAKGETTTQRAILVTDSHDQGAANTHPYGMLMPLRLTDPPPPARG